MLSLRAVLACGGAPKRTESYPISAIANNFLNLVNNENTQTLLAAHANERPIVRSRRDPAFLTSLVSSTKSSDRLPSAFHKYSTPRRNDVIHYHYRTLFYRIIDERNIDISEANDS